MDPTAPSNKDPNSQKPSNPIQTGQFAVAGDDGVFKEPPAPQVPPQASAPQNQTASTTEPISSTAPVSPSQPPPPPQPTPQQTIQPSMTTPPVQPPSAEIPLDPPIAVGSDAFSSLQPNPAPYIPPPNSEVQTETKNGGIKKLRVLIIGFAFLLLIGLIGALAYFFILKKPLSQTSKVSSSDVEIEVPSPPPARTSGGFAELPATSEAEPATQAATTQ